MVTPILQGPGLMLPLFLSQTPFQLATEDFAFEQNLSAAAQEVLKLAVNQKFATSEENNLSQAVTNATTVTFVSVHVRRTDYKEWLSRKVKGQLVSRCQFHQHFSRDFLVQKCYSQLISNYSLAFYFLA